MWEMKGEISSLSENNPTRCNFFQLAPSFRVNNEVMKTLRHSLLLIAIALAATSCYWHSPQTIIGSGPLETMDVRVGDFSGVAVTGQCNVHIFIGEETSVVFTAQSQILDFMTYNVKSGVLEIGFRNGYNVKSDREISADITVPSLDYIGITGAGNFEAAGAPQPYLAIHITGSGDVDAMGMEVEDCHISITGAGNCMVNATRSLHVDISGVGNVTYNGNPDVDMDVSGVGNVNRMNP